jgi:hypothetical protein
MLQELLQFVLSQMVPLQDPTNTDPQAVVEVGEPQTPAWQVSPLVQALLSSHDAPLAFGGFEQVPLAGSQVPASWHVSDAAHCFVVVDEPQRPLWQVSPLVHALPSLQRVPLAFAGFEQVPLAGSQVPGSWHWSDAGHCFVVVGEPQTPPWQVSLLVHALPSLQVVPLAFAGFEQVPLAGSQVPVSWH